MIALPPDIFPVIHQLSAATCRRERLVRGSRVEVASSFLTTRGVGRMMVLVIHRTATLLSAESMIGPLEHGAAVVPRVASPVMAVVDGLLEVAIIMMVVRRHLVVVHSRGFLLSSPWTQFQFFLEADQKRIHTKSTCSVKNPGRSQRG